MALTLSSRTHGQNATAPFRLSIKSTGTTRVVKSSSGILRGVFFSVSSDAPTLSLVDGTDGSGDVLVGTFVPVSATYYNFGDCIFKTGLFLTVAGTVDFTLFYF